jgi:hypothetical protein
MRFRWVNRNQTYRHEVRGGYLWSPKRNANGARNPFYESMREVAPGDLIFSFIDTRILAVGIAQSALSRQLYRARIESPYWPASCRCDSILPMCGRFGSEDPQCSRVPTIAEEDAKRPNRERDCLVGERTRIVNRIKSMLARLGIRNFKPTLRKAAERLATVQTPEGMPLPPNTLAELQRDMARLGLSSARSERSRTLVRND